MNRGVMVTKIKQYQLKINSITIANDFLSFVASDEMFM